MVRDSRRYSCDSECKCQLENRQRLLQLAVLAVQSVWCGRASGPPCLSLQTPLSALLFPTPIYPNRPLPTTTQPDLCLHFLPLAPSTAWPVTDHLSRSLRSFQRALAATPRASRIPIHVYGSRSSVPTPRPSPGCSRGCATGSTTSWRLSRPCRETPTRPSARDVRSRS